MPKIQLGRAGLKFERRITRQCIVFCLFLCLLVSFFSRLPARCYVSYASACTRKTKDSGKVVQQINILLSPVFCCGLIGA